MLINCLCMLLGSSLFYFYVLQKEGRLLNIFTCVSTFLFFLSNCLEVFFFSVAMQKIILFALGPGLVHVALHALHICTSLHLM